MTDSQAANVRPRRATASPRRTAEPVSAAARRFLQLQQRTIDMVERPIIEKFLDAQRRSPTGIAVAAMVKHVERQQRIVDLVDAPIARGFVEARRRADKRVGVVADHVERQLRITNVDASPIARSLVEAQRHANGGAAARAAAHWAEDRRRFAGNINNPIAQRILEADALRTRTFRVPDAVAAVIGAQQASTQRIASACARVLSKRKRWRETLTGVMSAPAFPRIASRLEMATGAAERLHTWFACEDASAAAVREDRDALMTFTRQRLGLNPRRYWRYVMAALLEDAWWNARDPILVLQRGAWRRQKHEQRREPMQEIAFDDRFEDLRWRNAVEEIELADLVDSLCTLPGWSPRERRALTAKMSGYSERGAVDELDLSKQDMQAGVQQIRRLRPNIKKRWKRSLILKP